MIELVVNGRDLKTPARTVAELLAEQSLSGVKVATAVNGHFLPEARRATTALKPGDRIEVVTARQGG